MAFAFLSNKNKAKFDPLLRELANSYLHRNDEYPCTVTEAHKLLVGWEDGSYTSPNPSNDEIAYSTIREEEEDGKELSNEEANILMTAGNNKGKVLRDRRGNVLECFICGGNHYSNTCDQHKEQGNEKKKKADHLHLTIADISKSYWNDTDLDGLCAN